MSGIFPTQGMKGIKSCYFPYLLQLPTKNRDLGEGGVDPENVGHLKE